MRRQVLGALDGGKHVFVEKPLALTVEEIAAIEAELERQGRRAAPAAGRLQPAIRAGHRYGRTSTSPPSPGRSRVVIRVNAGTLAADHWVHDPVEGGGRIIGEACHFIDLATALTGSCRYGCSVSRSAASNAPQTTDDRCLMTLRHADGSVSSIAYLAGGDSALPKERIEVFGGGRSAVIDDFRAVELFAGGRRSGKKLPASRTRDTRPRSRPFSARSQRAPASRSRGRRSGRCPWRRSWRSRACARDARWRSPADAGQHGCRSRRPRVPCATVTDHEASGGGQPAQGAGPLPLGGGSLRHEVRGVRRPRGPSARESRRPATGWSPTSRSSPTLPPTPASGCWRSASAREWTSAAGSRPGRMRRGSI